MEIKKLKVNVADEGPVIPEKERKRIFERFYTVSKSRAKNLSGTGLRLAIIKHIAEIYGGKAAVYENNIGGGQYLKEKYL